MERELFSLVGIKNRRMALRKKWLQTKNLERGDYCRQGAKGVKRNRKHVYRTTIKCLMKIKRTRRKIRNLYSMDHVR
jgi:hypothetical protein